jgi:hypothetical protein
LLHHGSPADDLNDASAAECTLCLLALEELATGGVAARPQPLILALRVPPDGPPAEEWEGGFHYARPPPIR